MHYKTSFVCGYFVILLGKIQITLQAFLYYKYPLCIVHVELFWSAMLFDSFVVFFFRFFSDNSIAVVVCVHLHFCIPNEIFSFAKFR